MREGSSLNSESTFGQTLSEACPISCRHKFTMRFSKFQNASSPDIRIRIRFTHPKIYVFIDTLYRCLRDTNKNSFISHNHQKWSIGQSKKTALPKRQYSGTNTTNKQRFISSSITSNEWQYSRSSATNKQQYSSSTLNKRWYISSTSNKRRYSRSNTTNANISAPQRTIQQQHLEQTTIQYQHLRRTSIQE